MTPFDINDDAVDDKLAAHLTRTLRAVAATVSEDEPAGSSSLTVIDRVAHARRRPRWRTRVALTGVVAAAAIIGLVVVQLPGRTNAGLQVGEPAWAADMVEVAETAPRLLITADGWRVTRVDEFDVDHGEITWSTSESTETVSSSGSDETGATAVEVEVPWTSAAVITRRADGVYEVFAPADVPEVSIVWTADDNQSGHRTYDEYFADLSARAQRLPDVTIAGHEAALFQTDPSPIYVALWKDGNYGVGVIGGADTLDEFRTITDSIEVVDIDTWLSALPADVIGPDDRADTVDEMLADVPLPAGFDRSSLVTDGGATEFYTLGARVTEAVACAWFDQWKTAAAAGDTAAVDEAVAAMATARDWTVLQQMDDEGGWSEAIWDLADAMAQGGTIDNGAGPVPAADFHAAGFGCG